MLASTPLPVVFLACANSYRKGRRLRYLVHERKAITQLLSQAPLPFYQPVQKGNLSTDYYLNLLKQYHYHQRIAYLHLVGHAQGDKLMIESDDCEAELTPQQLSELIDQLPHLQCVFLSGCATPGLLDLLLRKDIPAVMATQTYTRNREASAVAYTFYHHLARGESLRDAFRLVKYHHAGMRAFPVNYNVETDEMEWLAKEPDEAELSWGLYYLREHAPKLESAPRQRPLLSYAGERSRWGKRRPLRRLSFASTALILGLLAVSLVLSLQGAHVQTLLLAF